MRGKQVTHDTSGPQGRGLLVSIVQPMELNRVSRLTGQMFVFEELRALSFRQGQWYCVSVFFRLKEFMKCCFMILSANWWVMRVNG